MTAILPVTVTLLCAASGFVYFAAGDWRHGIFWTAAAVINGVTLTFR